MAIFSITTEHSDQVKDFIHQTKKRMKDSNLIKNPFTAKIIEITKGHNDPLYIFYLQPVYPNFTVFGWLIAFSILVIWGPNLFLIPCIALGLLGFFWSGYFYFIMAKIGMRKKGYKGKIKKLSCKQTLEKIYFGG